MAWTKAARDAAAMARKVHAKPVAKTQPTKNLQAAIDAPISKNRKPRMAERQMSSFLDRIPKVKGFTAMSKSVSPREAARKK